MATASQSYEARVSLLEVCIQAGVHPDVANSTGEFARALLDGDAGKIAPDWAGRASLSIRDAAEVVSNHHLAKLRFDIERSDYGDYLGERNRRRVEVLKTEVDREFVRQRDTLTKQQRNQERELKKERAKHGIIDEELGDSPMISMTFNGHKVEIPRGAAASEFIERWALDYARDVANDAGSDFDAKEPELSFEDWKRTRRKVAA